MNKENLLPQNDIHRRIIHLDMDAFYASVEMREHPEWKNKALIVGQDPRQKWWTWSSGYLQLCSS